MCAQPVVVALIMSAAVVPVVSKVGGAAAAPLDPACSDPGVITTSGTTVALNQDCSTTAPLIRLGTVT
jgi:hypothetical protein